LLNYHKTIPSEFDNQNLVRAESRWDVGGSPEFGVATTTNRSGIRWLTFGRPSRELVTVEPATTVATPDNPKHAAAPHRCLISNDFLIFRLFGTSAANVGVSAPEVFVPFA